MAGDNGATMAYSGGPPGHLPLSNTFDWVFSNPFQHESDYTPASQRVPKIEADKPIFVDNKTGSILTYSRLFKDSRTVAAGLQSLGLDSTEIIALPPTSTCPGPEIAPVVLIQLPNCLQFAPILLGTFGSGLTATLASPALTSTELAWILENSRPRVIVTAKACLDAMRGAIQLQKDAAFFKKVPIFTVDVVGDSYPRSSSPGSSPTATGEQDWKVLLAPTSQSLKPTSSFSAGSAHKHTAVILWSSGTSGRSKGVLLSHHALNFSTASLWHDGDFFQGQQQRWLGFVPFYHVFGLCNVLLLAICTGSTVYTMSAFNLEAVLSAIPKHKITYLHMAPPVAVMLAKAAIVEPYARRDKNGRNAFSTVVGAVTGGAPLGHDVVLQVYRRVGFRVRLGYGLSETCSTALQRGLTEEEMHADKGDTGRPHWGVEVMIAATEESGNTASQQSKTKAAPIDTPGEILVRCPGLMSAYLPVGGHTANSTAPPDMSVTQDALTPDGWFRTGDVGILNAKGHLFITDRLKELIKVRAFQVAPAELEAVLCSSDAVADAGVVGVYDESEATEWPRAFVVAAGAGSTTKKPRRELEALAEELRKHVESRTAKYKWLQGGIVFVDQVPKSPSGKILRRVMKDGGVKGVEVSIYKRKRRDVKL